MSVNLMLGDCLERMAEIEDGSVDAIVTDPPGGIAFMGKEWDGAKGGRDAWIEWLAVRLAECLRITKPGGRMLCWAIPRTSHWTGTAIEDAGWIVEDVVSHLFATGFPKAKSKLKPAAEFWWLARKPSKGVPVLPGLDACRIEGSSTITSHRAEMGYGGGNLADEYTTGSSLGRYPANLVLSHADGCVEVGTKRVKGRNVQCGEDTKSPAVNCYGDGLGHSTTTVNETVAAWQCVEGCPVAELDRQSGTRKSGGGVRRPHGSPVVNTFGRWQQDSYIREADSGGASRFFFVAKASKSDRGDLNAHPTVKSTALMSWLCRLITPPGGIIADPFMGSGSTGKAAMKEGFGFIGIERDESYFKIAQARIADAQSALPLLQGATA